MRRPGATVTERSGSSGDTVTVAPLGSTRSGIVCRRPWMVSQHPIIPRVRVTTEKASAPRSPMMVVSAEPGSRLKCTQALHVRVRGLTPRYALAHFPLRAERAGACVAARAGLPLVPTHIAGADGR